MFVGDILVESIEKYMLSSKQRLNQDLKRKEQCEVPDPHDDGLVRVRFLTKLKPSHILTYA